MPLEIEAKVGSMRNSLHVIIPQPIVKSLGLKKGDILLFSLTDHTMQVRKRD